MKLLIDGYNLLKTIDKNKTLSYDAITVYCNKLATYLVHKKLEGIIVFDGGMSFLQERSWQKELEILYVGRDRVADTFIKEYLDAYWRHDLLLVSSDRELNEYAQHYGVCSVDVQVFWEFVCAATRSKKKGKLQNTQIIKITDTKNDELDELMAQVTAKDIAYKNDMLEIYESKTDVKHASKTDKKLFQKMKKL